MPGRRFGRKIIRPELLGAEDETAIARPCRGPGDLNRARHWIAGFHVARFLVARRPRRAAADRSTGRKPREQTGEGDPESKNVTRVSHGGNDLSDGLRQPEGLPECPSSTHLVMAGLVPVIHEIPLAQFVDARHFGRA